MPKNKVTLKDIAEKLNVSVMTVSKALNDHPDISAARKDEIKTTAVQMGYLPSMTVKKAAESLPRMIGLIISDNTNPYYAEVIKGAESELYSSNYLPIIANTFEDEKKELIVIEQLKNAAVAGVLLTPSAYSSLCTEKLKEYHIPYVLINRYLSRHKDNYVVADDYSAGYLAAKRLAETGQNNIYALWFFEESPISEERMRGAQRAFSECGFTLPHDHIVYDLVSYQDGYDAMQGILTRTELPCSVLCFHDYIALGALNAIQNNGVSVPDQVSICGIDNIDYLNYIGLTSVELPKYEIGKQGARLLIELIAEQKAGKTSTEQHVILNTKLVERNSVRKAIQKGNK